MARYLFVAVTLLGIVRRLTGRSNDKHAAMSGSSRKLHGQMCQSRWWGE